MPRQTRTAWGCSQGQAARPGRWPCPHTTPTIRLDGCCRSSSRAHLGGLRRKSKSVRRPVPKWPICSLWHLSRWRADRAGILQCVKRERVVSVHPLAQGQGIKGAGIKRWAAGNGGIGKRRGCKAGQTGEKGRAPHAAFHFARCGRIARFHSSGKSASVQATGRGQGRCGAS
jgi:hypothetical protein